MKSSAEPNVRISGRAICTKNVRIRAPTRPPQSDAPNAAASARAASPCCDSGKPSSTVAWLALDPGIPMSTDVKVSDVGMTATRPISIASADTVSMPYRNGMSSDRPAIPPRPGKTPTVRPSTTPDAEKKYVLDRGEIGDCGGQGLKQAQPSRLTRKSSLSQSLTQTIALRGTSVASS